MFSIFRKVVIVMPRQLMRRSQSPPWRQLMAHFKKAGYQDHGFPTKKYGYQSGPKYYRPKQLHFAKDQYPHGGDDFDQGHEEVNHVMVPHGKGISHAVSFGKGYIPFDTYKDHRQSTTPHQNYIVEDHHHTTQDAQYSPTINYPVHPGYSRPFLSSQADSYAATEDGNHDEFQKRSQQRAAQNFRNENPSYNFKNIPSQLGEHPGVAQPLIGKPSDIFRSSSSISTPTINKQPIILRDSLLIDDYNKKLAELTTSWPNLSNNNHLIPGSILNTRQGSLGQFDGFSRQFGGLANSHFLINPDQGQKGYAVKEDVVDTPHDFRTMPIQTAPPDIQAPQVPQLIHQQPVQQTLQQFYAQPQVPANFGLPNFQGFVHG